MHVCVISFYHPKVAIDLAFSGTPKRSAATATSSIAIIQRATCTATFLNPLTRSDWYKNLLREPRVLVRVGTRRFEGRADCTTDPARITDLLELRLERHPRLVGRILEADGLPRGPSRVELEEYSRGLAMVEITPLK